MDESRESGVVCTVCTKELGDNEEHNFYDCLEFVKKDNADLEVQLEASQQQLAEAQDEKRALVENAESYIESVYTVTIVELKKQLAEAVTKRHKVSKDCDILRQQLAEAQAEVVDRQTNNEKITGLVATMREEIESMQAVLARVIKERDDLRKQLAASQAEVERLREELDKAYDVIDVLVPEPDCNAKFDQEIVARYLGQTDDEAEIDPR